MKKRYAFIHFLLIFCLLFIPIFILVLRTQPDELYTRIFFQDFENAVIEDYQTERYSKEVVTNVRPVIYVFSDFVVYADSNMVLSAPSEFFDELPHPFGEVFSMIAVYNMYIPQFLLPLLMIAFFILLVLQLFFYLISAAFLGVARLASTRFTFGGRVKTVIMSSLFPALLCAGIGFILPTVHIVLFQMLNLLLLFYLSKKYDRKERELLLSEENEE
ncbi:MAG: hypothetical protein FWG36_00720 [Oscillospiraceae bacterium]|nr:hypothetical protein [Oscillospiraceae bacterium]